MLLPSIFGENLFDDWMDFSFPEIPDVDKTLYGKHAKNMMKTDVPGFKKDEIQLELNDGYLTISAEKGLDKEEKDKKDKYIRRERYAGSMSRTFYVGESVTENDIHAKYENGILTLDVPKEEAKKVPEKRYISIEG
jgi:HSP20 family protein